MQSYDPIAETKASCLVSALDVKWVSINELINELNTNLNP